MTKLKVRKEEGETWIDKHFWTIIKWILVLFLLFFTALSLSAGIAIYEAQAQEYLQWEKVFEETQTSVSNPVSYTISPVLEQSEIYKVVLIGETSSGFSNNNLFMRVNSKSDSNYSWFDYEGTRVTGQSSFRITRSVLENRDIAFQTFLQIDNSGELQLFSNYTFNRQGWPGFEMTSALYNGDSLSDLSNITINPSQTISFTNLTLTIYKQVDAELGGGGGESATTTSPLTKDDYGVLFSFLGFIAGVLTSLILLKK